MINSTVLILSLEINRLIDKTLYYKYWGPQCRARPLATMLVVEVGGGSQPSNTAPARQCESQCKSSRVSSEQPSLDLTAWYKLRSGSDIWQADSDERWPCLEGEVPSTTSTTPHTQTPWRTCWEPTLWRVNHPTTSIISGRQSAIILTSSQAGWSPSCWVGGGNPDNCPGGP